LPPLFFKCSKSNVRNSNRFQRGLKRKPLALVKKLRKAKMEASSGEKPEAVRTHLRNMIIVPEMIGSVVGVYNGKTFNQVCCCWQERLFVDVYGLGGRGGAWTGRVQRQDIQPGRRVWGVLNQVGACGVCLVWVGLAPGGTWRLRVRVHFPMHDTNAADAFPSVDSITL
jgi:ribosomal protein S19